MNAIALKFDIQWNFDMLFHMVLFSRKMFGALMCLEEFDVSDVSVFQIFQILQFLVAKWKILHNFLIRAQMFTKIGDSTPFGIHILAIAFYRKHVLYLV